LGFGTEHEKEGGMKTKFKNNKTIRMNLPTILLVGALLPAAVSLGQPPPPPPGAPPPIATQAAATADGTVSQYLMNPDGDVDGLLLADGTQVKFPPHMSNDLIRVVKPTDKISVQGERENARVVTGFTITNAASGQSVTEAPPSALRPPPGLRAASRKLMQADGKVRVVLYAPRGEPEGAVLENGTIVRVPPHIGVQFATLLQAGQTIFAKGYGTENQFGRCIEATEIGAAGQTPTAIYGALPQAPVPPPPVR
jgi:hypothetical protein